MVSAMHKPAKRLQTSGGKAGFTCNDLELRFFLTIGDSLDSSSPYNLSRTA